MFQYNMEEMSLWSYSVQGVLYLHLMYKVHILLSFQLMQLNQISMIASLGNSYEGFSKLLIFQHQVLLL